jgi:hypothetical protein
VEQNERTMKKIEILKNGKMVRQFICKESDLQKKFEYAVDIAGGMWNGKDNFKVVILNF